MPIVTDYKHAHFYCPGYCSGNAAAAKKFYSELLGWEPHDMSMDGEEFTMFKLKGHNVAGMYQMAPDRAAAGVKPHWNSYMMVNDVVAFARKTEELGGKIVTPPFDADDCIMVNLADPEGIRFSAWQPIKSGLDATITNETGAHCWTELATLDSTKAQHFYSQLTGWELRPFEGSPMPYTTISAPGAQETFGGIFEITPEMQGFPAQWFPYFMVADIHAASDKVPQLGGTFHGIIEIKEVGPIAVAQDAEGAYFALIHPQT